MRQLKRFTDILWRSLTDRSYYRDILQASLGFSVKYAFILLFILSFANTIRLAVQLVPNFPKIRVVVSQLKDSLLSIYPQELVVTIKDGTLATNVEQPYYIDLPGVWTESTVWAGRHFMAIDTNASAEDFPTFDSVVLITGSSIVYAQEQGRTTVQSLSQLVADDLIIDILAYNKFIANISPYLDAIEPLAWVFLVLLVFFGPIAGALIGLAGKLIYLLFAALLVLLLAKILNTTYGYKELYRLSLHGITMPILVTYALSVFGYIQPVLFTFLYLGWMTIVLIYLRDTQPKPTSMPHQRA